MYVLPALLIIARLQDMSSGSQSGKQQKGDDQAGTGGAQMTVMLVRSCGGQPITITHAMVHTMPRKQLEGVFGLLVRTLNDGLSQSDKARPPMPSHRRPCQSLLKVY